MRFVKSAFEFPAFDVVVQIRRNLEKPTHDIRCDVNGFVRNLKNEAENEEEEVSGGGNSDDDDDDDGEEGDEAELARRRRRREIFNSGQQ